jgi:hypothetical protein
MAQFQGLSALAVLTTPDFSGTGFVGMVCRDGLQGWSAVTALEDGSTKLVLQGWLDG